ncbi:hypothetical protein [Bacillus suaedaesalsae]|uniref:Phenylalanyl-tRNA synthetase subunit beta n=1 Tax=Bacillus suaedaesalsae TaxID=2810349 RepID=A0ABS2DFL0_9BACI|nr:hypothetical protein [Bacillus suaedaesalsae]MBM6617253.1 hypothetical protein [Bacillus suaedaesalsae]
MKFVKWIGIPLVMIVIIALIAYKVGTAYVSDQVAKQVYDSLEENGELHSIMDEVKRNPKLEELLSEVETVDDSTLPFSTKEEATKVLMKRFTVDEILNIQSRVSDGISIEDEEELVRTFEEKLTEEELLALKVIALKEYQK